MRHARRFSALLRSSSSVSALNTPLCTRGVACRRMSCARRVIPQLYHVYVHISRCSHNTLNPNPISRTLKCSTVLYWASRVGRCVSVWEEAGHLVSISINSISITKMGHTSTHTSGDGQYTYNQAVGCLVNSCYPKMCCFSHREKHYDIGQATSQPRGKEVEVNFIIKKVLCTGRKKMNNREYNNFIVYIEVIRI